jgi:hypothetical protein
MGRESSERARTALHFDHSVPKGELKLRHNVLRTPGKGKIDLCLQSDDFLGHQVHFYGGQSQPHFADPCEGCLKGIDLRWEGYIWARRGGSGELVFFAFPPTAGSVIEGLRGDFGSLAGLVIQCQRLQGRTNGPVAVKLLSRVEHFEAPRGLPPVDLFLSALWRKSVQRQLQGTNDPLGEIPAAQQGMYDSLFQRVNGNSLAKDEVSQ